MDGKKVLRLLLDVLVLSLTLKHNGAAAGDLCPATSECLNGGVLHCKFFCGSNGNQFDLSCYCDCPNGYFGPTCESTTCKTPTPPPTPAPTPAPTTTRPTDGEICDAPDDEFITLQRSSMNLWRIDSSGNAVVSHTAPVSLSSLGMMRVGNTVYFGLGQGGQTKGVYQIDWCDTSNTTAVTLLADITSVNTGSYVGDMAYLRSIDKLLVFASGHGWLSVDPITGNYTNFYPTDGSTLTYSSYGAVIVGNFLYWTTYTSPSQFLRLDVSDPLNLPAHSDVSPGFSPGHLLRDLIYYNGIIYIVDQDANVYAYDPNFGGTPQMVIQGTNDFTTSLTWFNTTHLLISKVNVNEVSIVEIGTPSSPTPSSAHQLFSSVTNPLPILNLADYYIPA